MQKFLSLLFSRRALAVVGVLVLALLVWFVGPLVSFDTLRPLASVGSRVVTIALLLMLLVLWLVNWSMSIIGISVLCLAIGFVTPLLALGDVHPFAPLWVRLTLIGFILLMYALYGLYRLWRALRMDEQLLRRFLHPRGEEVPVAGEIKADLRTVNHIVTQAIRQLRQLRVDMPGWRKIFEGKRFLYELPWFMVVGSPGDGKTTALLNTGLQFPLAEQMEQTSRILTVPGGGTLHCDWWFTNEAVLIDTAGRYARHDDGGEASAAQRNAGEWQGFLGLLRKHRPGAPLNGVILTLNVADLTAQSPAERLAACAALRARLAELRETLGIRFPVYLVVTKMDLLPGFSEYFRTLTSHLRAQIWGFTLPYSRRRKAGDPQALHAAWPELDPDAPPLAWRYGLYSVPPVTDSVASLYNRLLDQLLLPPLVKRMEYVLADAIARQDSKAAYDALRIYLLLNLDKDHEDKYNAAEIQSWVINDLGNSDSVAGFGGRAAVLTHIEALFDGSRVVHSPYEKDEALIRQARAFLDGHTSTERIYARALAAMESEAPQEFTLVRAVGADAGTVFVRSNGAPLDRGVPGIFTREGYRELFDKRLPEFVAAATANDGWVMGRESTPKKLTDSLRSQIPGQEQSVAREVRRLYLTEYARRWQDFLDSIHSINSAGEEGSSGLAYDLQVLRTLASPDSPLMRLGKAVVEQTTLVPPPDPQARQKQLAQRASGNAGKVVQTAKLFQDIHPEERLEKTLVDDRFAALREVIAGRTDGGQSGGGTMQIASLLTMLNEYYTQLTIADSALAAGTLPARITAADKLQLEAAKLPAPLKNILLDLTKQGTRKINAGTGDVLNTQMEAMMGDDCRDAIDGRYPFADSPQEVSAEDFNRIFASGGVLDAFWSKQLAPLADTASDPWRYKPTEGNMTLQGPDLTPFQQAKQIRSVFFNSEGGKKFSWSMQISVVDMDPAITELVIDIDGQVLRYAHGPDRPLKVTWPGPRNGSMAEITASPRIRQDTSTLLTGGPWALFHLLDAGMVQETAVRGRQLVEYDFDGRRVVLEITAGRDFNPVSRELLQNFSCPARAL
ncbi:type VI secretion system membrane subunit TssM [Salmonella enterica subsp. enterica serovar Typhimurium]|uniref:Type VI secretion system membrane subunit TssM n=1 Tax=Salmonella typhimurium TaxID=90371 RepID=A0A635QI35_SALTM|nr:type VI secretion system membrane subunit TssM [Salmonella enterica subsp. enterica serovar Typhimurium]